MKRSPNWSVVIAVVLCIAGIATAQQEAPKYKELPNFGSVNATLFRGGQPNKGGIKKLLELGIKTIINLRNADAHEQVEEAEARAAGLRYFNLPLDTFGRPADKAIDEVLKLITAKENQPVFVHCKRGADRTGTVIAIYRISVDGWTSEQAKAEAKRYGLGFWQVGMKDYIHDYYERRKK